MSHKVYKNPKGRRSVTMFPLPSGLVSLDDLKAEIDTMTEVLMGRKPPPVEAGIMTMLEVASTYLGRALEIQLYLLRGEQEGQIIPKSPAYKFRTGELRTFVELVKSKAELGSRRVTALQLDPELASIYDQEHDRP